MCFNFYLIHFDLNHVYLSVFQDTKRKQKQFKMMKIITKFSVLLLLVATAFSCESLDELTEFDVSENFSSTFNISIPEDTEGMPASLNVSTDIDISTNQDIQDNLDLIQDVTINSITYEIDNFSGAEGAILTDGLLTFGSTTISVSDVNLQQSDSDNTIYTISDVSAINAIANTLENDISVTATLSGTVSATPVVFDIILNVDLTATIDII